MRRILSLLSLLAVAMFCACSSDVTKEPTTGGIAGSVSDRTTGEPVATVNVSINPGGSSTVTGSDGTFMFRNLEEGSYTLTITKEGYKQSSSTVSVHAGDQTSAHLLIERIPAVVTADRELLDFGDNSSANTLSFNIVNPGYVDLAWEIEERCEWITEIKPEEGTLKYGKTEGIVVVIDREKLAEGSNEAVIVIRSSNGSSEVKVTAVGAERYVAQLNTLDATEITSSSATLNGEITDVGVPAYTERGFVYSLNSMPTFDNMIARLTSRVTEDAAYSYVLRGLVLGEKYYVRAYAINSIGTAYSSNEINFTTVASSPELTVQDVTDMSVSKTSATFNGTVVRSGDPAYFERGFVYSTDSNPTVNNTKVKANGTGEGIFSANVSGLTLNQRYYVRTYAISKIKDSEQEFYSKEQVSFIISTTSPQVSIQAVSNLNVNAATATLNGTVINAGDPAYIERGFVYGTTSNPTTEDTKVKANGSGEGVYSANISGLRLNQQYHVRAYATSKVGDDAQTVYSTEQVNFTLSSTAPAVTVQEVTNLNVSAGTATFNGTVTNTGTPAYTERGFVYGTTRNPTVSDTKLVASGTGAGTYSLNVSNIELNKTYYVRTYAIGTSGTVYSSQDVSFSLTTDAPSISVQAVTNLNVSAGTATLNGTVISAGNPAYIERGFVYAMVDNPTVDDTKVKTSGTGVGTFKANISGLRLNQTYYVRTYAIYKVGETGQIVYSSTQESFTLTPTAPAVTVQEVTNLNVSAGTATFNGTVTNTGTPAYTECGFVYGATRNPTISDTKLIASGTGTGEFSLNVSNLELNKTYYVRAYAVGATGTVYSPSDISFSLATVAPSISVYSVTDLNVTARTATLEGMVSAVGNPAYTERGFVYGATRNPTTSDTKIIAGGTSTGRFSVNISNLERDKVYYVRAYAINIAGTAYSSNDQSFTLTTTLPRVHLYEPKNVNVSLGSATVEGLVYDTGEPPYTERGFVYGLYNNPTVNDEKIIVTGSGAEPFHANITGLLLDQTYYVRAYATNTKGTVYSQQQTISTMAILPKVSTLEVTNANMVAGTATFNGNIESAGEPAYTERGFVYSTTPEPTMNDKKIVASSSGAAGTFNVNATGLPTDRYYVRAYATNRGGTVYGEQMQVDKGYLELPSAGIAVQTKDITSSSSVWNIANSACEGSSVGGYNDWRLPTIAELVILYNNLLYIGSFNTSKSSSYWSSEKSTADHYVVYFNSGSIVGNAQTSGAYGRCIRTINKTN